MNFDRYLATYHPIFHRTSVTKGRLFTLFILLIIIEGTLDILSFNDVIFPKEAALLAILTINLPSTFFINYKLYKIARHGRRNDGLSPEVKKSFSLKNISSCLFAVGFYFVLSIPTCVYIGQRKSSRGRGSIILDKTDLFGLWAITLASVNSTCNCLIFYWKNKVLRNEGVKVIKSVQICRRVTFTK